MSTVWYHPKFDELCVKNKKSWDFHPAFDWYYAHESAMMKLRNGWIYIGVL